MKSQAPTLDPPKIESQVHSPPLSLPTTSLCGPRCAVYTLGPLSDKSYSFFFRSFQMVIARCAL